MNFRDFKGLDEVNVNGRDYVDKEQLLKLIKDEKKRHMDGTESGYLHQSKEQKFAASFALNHLAVLIRKKFYEALCEDISKFVIVAGGDQVLMYFRGWCGAVPGEHGKPMPVFSAYASEGMRFDTFEDAKDTLQEILKEHPMVNAIPVKTGMTRYKHTRQTIHSILGWPENRDPKEVLEDEEILSR